MKQSFWSKFASLLLVLAMLTACTSCGLMPPRGEPEATGGEQRLTVTVLPVSYTEDEIGTACVRLADAVRIVCYAREKLVLSDGQLESVKTYVRDRILPALCGEGIVADELDALCTVCERYADAMQNGEETGLLEQLCGVYRDTVEILGNERAGAVLYTALLCKLEYEIAVCEDRYANYGYEWYREDAERFSAQKRSLTETLGKEDFAVICGFFFFAFTAITTLSEDGASLGDGIFTDAEILALMRRQSCYFAGRELTDEQWRAAVELLFAHCLNEAALPDSLTAAQSGVLKALQRDEEYGTRVGLVMPSALRLYASVCNSLTDADIERMRTGDEVTRTATLAGALASDREGFLAFAEDVLRYASAGEDDRQLAALRKAGLSESYTRYAENATGVSAEALYNAVSQHAASGTAETLTALDTIYEGFLFTVAPCVTFAFSISVKENNT